MCFEMVRRDRKLDTSWERQDARRRQSGGELDADVWEQNAKMMRTIGLDSGEGGLGGGGTGRP